MTLSAQAIAIGMSCASPAVDLAAFVGPGPGERLVYELKHDGSSAGTIELRFLATCGAACSELESATAIGQLTAVKRQERIWISDGALWTAPSVAGKVDGGEATRLLQLPLRPGSSWNRDDRVYPAERTSSKQSDPHAAPKPVTESLSCRIDEVAERLVLERRRVVVSVTCEKASSSIGVAKSVREEYAEGIGLISVTEEYKGEGQSSVLSRTLRAVEKAG